MIIAVIDGMGGGIGAQIVSSLREDFTNIHRYICFRYKFNSH